MDYQEKIYKAMRKENIEWDLQCFNYDWVSDAEAVEIINEWLLWDLLERELKRREKLTMHVVMIRGPE